MTSRAPAQRQPKEIPVENLDASILAAWHELPGTFGMPLGLWVDTHEVDAITQAIAKRAYAYPPAFELMATYVKPGMRVLDLGAHIGTFSLFAATLAGEVMAVEASPKNVALLRESAKDNGFNNLHVIQKAISDHSDWVEFIESGPYGVIKNQFIASSSLSVQALSVDELLAAAGWTHIDFIKMDIEGSEVAAVRGMPRLLSQADAPLILFESNGHTLHLFGESPNRLLSTIEAFGYQCYLVDSGRLVPVAADDLQPGCVEDYLAAKTLPQLPSWPVAPPLAFDEIVTRILATAVYDHPAIRIYIGRALSQPNAALYLNDQRVRRALSSLLVDSDADVRAAVTWWQPGEVKPISRSMRLAQRFDGWIRRVQSKIRHWLKQV